MLFSSMGQNRIKQKRDSSDTGRSFFVKKGIRHRAIGFVQIVRKKDVVIRASWWSLTNSWRRMSDWFFVQFAEFRRNRIRDE